MPIRLMQTFYSNPRPDAFLWLKDFSIPEYIERKYQSPEDVADALDGAFTGFHIHAHVSRNPSSEEEWLDEILGWYDCVEQKNTTGPFFDALEQTLIACGMQEFYKKGIDHIIKYKGKLV